MGWDDIEDEPYYGYGLVTAVDCATDLSEGEHLVPKQKLEIKMLEQRDCLGSRYIQELIDRSDVSQGLGAAGHSFQTLWPPMGGFL